jgi:TatD DNase family protein
MLIDTHAHLSAKQYDHDLNEVIERAASAGIEAIIVVGVDDDSNHKVIDICQTHDSLYAAVGIHPSDVEQGNFKVVQKLISHPKVVAIGETGLDLHWRQDNLNQQITSFEQHIKLAIKYDLPLIIHCRKAFDEIFEVLAPYKHQLKGVFHCFSGNHEQAIKAIELGFYIGLSNSITYPKEAESAKAAKHIPLTKIVLETDCPYLGPVARRYERNEPEYVINVALKLAELKAMPYQTICQQTTINANKLFNLKGGTHNEKA